MRGFLDADGVAEPDLGRERRAARLRHGKRLEKRPVRPCVGRLVALEHDGLGARRGLTSLVGGGDLAQLRVALLVADPHHLERAVALEQAAGIVVDGLAGPGEEPGGGVVVGEDELAVGLGALERDAYAHLAHGAAGDAVRAAERLAAEDHVHAEGAALAHQPVEEER